MVLVLEHGYSAIEAAEAVGVQRRAVHRWLAVLAIRKLRGWKKSC
ncbi:hypothetical protein [Oligoflexus tunisiensis]